MMFRRLAIAAAAAFLLGLGFGSPAQAIECTDAVQYDTNTNGATRLLTGSATSRFFICGYTIVSGGTVSVGFVTGTGTNCGTNQTNLTPQYSTVAQTVITESASAWRGLTVLPGRDMCIKASSGVAVSAIVYYRRQ